MLRQIKWCLSNLYRYYKVQCKVQYCAKVMQTIFEIIKIVCDLFKLEIAEFSRHFAGVLWSFIAFQKHRVLKIVS